uniref:Uncharacterized protein n=1 Tax=Poecilia reticulata TaxID=8081 RepID=A0A3P9N5F0_POERE
MLTSNLRQNLFVLQDGAMNGNLDSLGVGHCLASPVVILHSHIKGHQPSVLGAQSSQLILARALEVVLATIKGTIVRVTRGCTLAVADGPASTLSIDYGAFLIGRAGCVTARHHAQSCVTRTQATASLISPELLAWLEVAALI